MSKEKKIKRMQQQQAMQGAATPNSVLDAVKSNHQNQAQEIKTENKEEKMVSQHIEQDTSKKTESDMLISHNDAINAAQNDAKTGAIVASASNPTFDANKLNIVNNAIYFCIKFIILIK